MTDIDVIQTERKVFKYVNKKCDYPDTIFNQGIFDPQKYEKRVAELNCESGTVNA